MKLVIAIVRDEDGNNCMLELNKNGFYVTKLATTGGFLRAGNMTILSCVEEDRVDDVMKLVKKTCCSRTTLVTTPASASVGGAFSAYPIEVEIGGATVFVVDVERFEKL